jgi:hypothetical protein
VFICHEYLLTICCVSDAQLDVLVSQMEKADTKKGIAASGPAPKIDSKVSSRSLGLYKQTLRESGGESSHQEDTEDELREEEKWWRGEESSAGKPSLSKSASRKLVFGGDLTQSFGNVRASNARKSLDDILKGLNERDSMTDEELEHEVRMTTGL